MPRTYTNLLTHIIFSTKNRQHLLTENVTQQLYPYFSGILKNLETQLIAIGGITDHIHLLIASPPKHALSDIMKQLKGSSSRWINEQNLTPTHFEWQDGFGAFTVAESTKPETIAYIKNQAQHHQTKTFAQEYQTFLEKNQIQYHPTYYLE